MTRLLCAAFLGLALALPASAAKLDPSTLVLRQADVPAGFEVSHEGTGVRSNEREARNEPRAQKLLASWGRVTGYQAAFERDPASISSRADVLRARAGANEMLDWFVLELRKSGIRGFRRVAVEVGDEAVMYRGASAGSLTIVGWRSGRVFAAIGTAGLSRERTVRLVRIQQRRIAAALG